MGLLKNKRHCDANKADPTMEQGAGTFENIVTLDRNDTSEANEGL